MDLQKSLADAHIVRVAIVDDDLSELISTANLSLVNGDLETLLSDPHDPDRQAYMAVLTTCGYRTEDLEDLALPLSDKAVRDQTPARLREAAEQILDARRGNAQTVRRIKELLENSGIANIDTYHSPKLPDQKRYDLLIVDYYLVDDATHRTVPFIKDVVRTHSDQEHPVQIILMSSHEVGLKADFRDLRPRVSVSSSRMRILAKPQNNEQLATWKLTLGQMAADRDFVVPIETFVNRTIETIESAAKHQSVKLWELDLQAMHLLHETAAADNDDYSRYVEECISRHLLTRLEEVSDLREALEKLRDQLVHEGQAKVISAGVEIGDNRAAVRGLMTSMEWRGGGAPQLPAYPVDPNLRPKWVQSALRFGMVLQDPEGRIWLNLTQSCDLAQAKPSELPELSLLFISGVMSHPTQKGDGDALVHMNATMSEAESDTITWKLRRILAPTVATFAEDFGAGWSVAGELRLDQAQNVVAKYGAQASRVGLQSPVRSWRLQGVAFLCVTLRDAAETALVNGTSVTGQALKRGKDSQELHFELSTYTALQTAFPGTLGDDALRLCAGVKLKPGSKSPGQPYLLYCPSPPATMGELRAKLKDDQWLKRADNANKLVVAVWAA